MKKDHQESLPACVRCAVLACREEAVELPDGCPMLVDKDIIEEAGRALLADEDRLHLAASASRVEAEGYCEWTRLREVMELARRLGVTRLGIACCVGLRKEAAIAQSIFEAQGFEVASAICKLGRMPKESLGLADEEKIRPGGFESACNPVAQAMVLDAADVGLHVIIGLCVGHDSLYFMTAKAPVTVLVAKDRVTGHNPAAALYTAHSYYRQLKVPSAASSDS